MRGNYATPLVCTLGGQPMRGLRRIVLSLADRKTRRHPATKSRETAARDFDLELRRSRGFELDIVSGQLLVNEVGATAEPPEEHDFRGGAFRIRVLRPGSDGLRLLKELPSPRKVQLEFKSPDGREFSFPASLAKSSTAASSTGP